MIVPSFANNLLTSSPFKKSTSANLTLDTSPTHMTGGMQPFGTDGNNHQNSGTFIKNEPLDNPGMFGDYSNSHFTGHYSDSFRDNINPADLMQQAQSFPRNIPQQHTNVYHNGFGNDFTTMAVSDNDLVNLGSALQHQKGQLEDEGAAMMARGPSMMSDYNNYGHISPDMSSPMQRPVDQPFGSVPDNFGDHSPFIPNFPHSFGGFRRNGPYGNVETPSSMASPLVGGSDDSGKGSAFDGFMNDKRRINMERQGSKKGMLSKSPHTPSSGMNGLSLSIPGAVPQPIHKRHTSHSGAWEGTAGSFADSTLSSPGFAISPHPPIQDIMAQHSKHASLPTKVEAFQSQEAKRRRRRESHNMVERRRRDNINERIQELSHLVPHHRLDDEKVRKHLSNNTALPPSIAGTGMSPPRGNMMNPSGRRGSTLANGLPGDDKDKGPNKGDILNGAVYWTRDLMWAYYQKIQEEKKLKEVLQRLNEPWPFEETEDERRFKAELCSAVEKNGVANFSYSRHVKSGLFVPGFTMLNGEALQNEEGEEKKPNSNDANNFWNDSDMVVKEEEEFRMDSTF